MTTKLLTPLAACALLACAASPQSHETAAPRATPTAHRDAAPPRAPSRVVPPRIVAQPLREQVGYFYRGRGFRWIVSCQRRDRRGLSEVSLREADTGRVLDRFDVGGRSLRCLLSPDGTRVAVLSLPFDAPSLRTAPTLSVFDRVERRWLWRRELPAPGANALSLLVGDQDVALASCAFRDGHLAECDHHRFGLAAGEPRPEPASRWPQVRLEFGDWQVSPDGRYALVHERLADGESGPTLPAIAGDPDATAWNVYSLATAQQVFGFVARCARFADDGALAWVPANERDAAANGPALSSLGIRSVTATSEACPTTPRNVEGEQVTAASDDARFVLTRLSGSTHLRDLASRRVIDEQHPADWRDHGQAFRPVSLGQGHVITWSDGRGLNVYGGAGAPVPRRLFATDSTGSNDAAYSLAVVDARDGSINLVDRDLQWLRWSERDLAAAAPVALTGPRGMPLDCRGCTLDQILADGTLVVGERFFGNPTRAPGHLAPLPAIHGGHAPAPAWVRAEDGWRFVWPDVLEGIQVIDATRARTAATYATRAQGWDHPYGVWPTRDGRAAWVLVPSVAGPRAHLGFSLVDLATGRVLRTLGGTDDVLVGSAMPDLGWAVPDHELWLTSGENESVELVEVPENEQATQVAVRRIGMPGAGHGSYAADHSFFVAALPDEAGVRVYRTDGAVVLTANVWRDGGYVYTPDGRFACERGGCERLRCTVDGESRPATDPACASARRPAIAWEQALHE